MITCYATPGKAKAERLCQQFAAGIQACGERARVVLQPPAQLHDGAAVFYGVVPETAHLWQQARREGRDWYYIDNSYFDASRGTHYRITRNAVQFKGIAPSDGKRRAALGLPVSPMRDGGDHVVICLQSPSFMKVVAETDPQAWFDGIRAKVARRGLLMRLRGWNGDKGRQMATLKGDLQRAALLVTWSSAAAIEAYRAGVPVQVAEQSAAQGIAPAQRDDWLNSLADNQWTLDELSNGTAWRALRA